MRNLVYPLFLYLVMTSMVFADDYSLDMKEHYEDGMLTLTPSVTGRKDESVFYKLTSIKQGRAGNSQTSQSGKLLLQAGNETPVATLSLAINHSDRYSVKLELYSAEKLLVAREILYP